MKKHLLIVVALGLLAGTCYASSSPPVHGYAVNKKERIEPITQAITPIDFVAIPNLRLYADNPVTAGSVAVLPTISCVTTDQTTSIYNH